MKKALTLIIATLGMLAMAPPAKAEVQLDAQLRITPHPRQDLEVYVWPDRGMDGIYYPGELISVNVEVTRDAFLILYNLDTQGNLQILFPSSPWDDNFVRSGDVISFPRRSDDVDWTVDGPSGTEYIQAIASEIPINLPEWPVYLTEVDQRDYPDASMRNFRAGNDRYEYIDIVNRNISGRYYDWCATDVATFLVHPAPRYHHSYDSDPWPETFYGSVYIGWPFGSRIYVDNIYIGVAPCWVPNYYVGRHIITCYDGPRLIRTHQYHCYSKRDYYVHNQYRGPREIVLRKGRWDANDHFRYEKDSGHKNKYRVYDRDGSRDYSNDGERWKTAKSKDGSGDDRFDGARTKQDSEKRKDSDWDRADNKSTREKSKPADSGTKKSTEQSREKVSKGSGKSSIGSADVIRQGRGTNNFEVKTSKKQVQSADKRNDSFSQEKRVTVSKRSENSSAKTSAVIRQESGNAKLASKSAGKRSNNATQESRVTISKRTEKTMVEKSAVAKQGSSKAKVEANTKAGKSEKSGKPTKHAKKRGE